VTLRGSLLKRDGDIAGAFCCVPSIAWICGRRQSRHALEARAVSRYSRRLPGLLRSRRRSYYRHATAFGRRAGHGELARRGVGDGTTPPFSGGMEARAISSSLSVNGRVSTPPLLRRAVVDSPCAHDVLWTTNTQRDGSMRGSHMLRYQTYRPTIAAWFSLLAVLWFGKRRRPKKNRIAAVDRVGSSHRIASFLYPVDALATSLPPGRFLSRRNGWRAGAASVCAGMPVLRHLWFWTSCEEHRSLCAAGRRSLPACYTILCGRRLAVKPFLPSIPYCCAVGENGSSPERHAYAAANAAFTEIAAARSVC